MVIRVRRKEHWYCRRWNCWLQFASVGWAPPGSAVPGSPGTPCSQPCRPAALSYSRVLILHIVFQDRVWEMSSHVSCLCMQFQSLALEIPGLNKCFQWVMQPSSAQDFHLWCCLGQGAKWNINFCCIFPFYFLFSFLIFCLQLSSPGPGIWDFLVFILVCPNRSLFPCLHNLFIWFCYSCLCLRVGPGPCSSRWQLLQHFSWKMPGVYRLPK